jgi:DNA-binding transcriptional MerR regulator
MLIGRLASSSGFSRDTIRYYEKLGLLELGKNDRRENNYKVYPPQALERLEKIDQLKKLGFTLVEIKGLFGVLEQEAGPCTNLPEQLDQKLKMLRRKIALLEDYEEKLIKVRQGCNANCGITEGLPTCFAIQKN